MTDNISAVLYLISSIFFILALRGLSSPDSARQGNLFGVLGMTIAVGTTLALPNVLSYEARENHIPDTTRHIKTKFIYQNCQELYR